MKIEYNLPAFKQARELPEVAAQCDSLASRIAAKAGHGYGWDGRAGKARYRAIVYPETMMAKVRDAKTNNLLKTMESFGQMGGGG